MIKFFNWPIFVVFLSKFDSLYTFFLKYLLSELWNQLCLKELRQIDWLKMIDPIGWRNFLLTGFELAICKSQFTDPLCLFMDHFKQFFVKFAYQNFPSIRIFVFEKTTVSVSTSCLPYFCLFKALNNTLVLRF